MKPAAGVMVAKPAMAPTHKPTRVGRPKRIHSILGGAGEKVMEASYKQKSEFVSKKPALKTGVPKSDFCWKTIRSFLEIRVLFVDVFGAESGLFFCFGELWVINPSKTTRWNQLGCLFTG